MSEQAITAARKYILRQCGAGNDCACETGKRVFVAARMSMAAAADLMNFQMGDDHPNRMPFKGVLLILDQASTKPPHGSRGHRIYVPTEVARKKLIGLIGMAVNYDPEDLNEHETRHKVGIISKAWIKGNQVWVKGIIWKKDFPEAVGKLSNRRDLGMSMELADVYVRDEHEDIWHLEDFEFTGATILKKSAAAYYSTELSATSDRKNTVLAATAAAASGKQEKGEVMSQTKAKARVAAASNSGGNAALLVSALKGAMGEVIGPLVTEIRASNERGAKLEADLEELKGLHLINASAEEDDDMSAAMMKSGMMKDGMMKGMMDEDDDDDMAAAMKKKDMDDDDDDDDDNMDDDDDKNDSEGEDDDLNAELEDLSIDPAEEEPGEVNEHGGDMNKGDKTTVSNPPMQKEHLKGNIAKKRLKSAASKKPFPGLKGAGIQAAAVMVQTMQARMARQRQQYKQMIGEMQAAAVVQKKEMKKMKVQLQTLQAQAEKHAETLDRRSHALPVDIRNLVAKAGVDVREIQAGSADKLTVAGVDNVFNVLASEGVPIEPVKRAEYKNRLVELGLMENGEERYSA